MFAPIKIAGAVRQMASPMSRAIAQLRHNKQGIAAVEFSLIVPILLILIFGCIELVNAIENWRKVMLLTRTAADLTSQGDIQNPISTQTMTNIYTASGLILAPFEIAKAKLTISAVGVGVGSATPNAYVCSSWSNASAPRAVGLASTIVVPLNYKRVGARFVLVEVTMPYTPVLGTIATSFIQNFNTSFLWSETAAWPVRGGQSYSATSDSEIVLPNGAKC